MTTATPPRPQPPLLDLPPVADVRAPAWFDRLPRRLATAGVLAGLILISAVLRTRTLGGEYWFQEAGAVGLASHSLGDLLGAVHRAGAAPLYYVLLHLWMSVFGSGERATHALSLLIGLSTIPVAMWVGWGLGGRRAGYFAAVLFAFSSFLTRYAQETQPYELMVLLGLLATAGFLQGLVYRRRRALWLLGVGLALMLYTQGAALLYWLGAAAAVFWVWRAAEDRGGVLRDAGLCFAGAAVVYLPWLPATIDQVAHATSPLHYSPLLGATVPSQLLGAERIDVTLLVAFVIGLVPLLAGSRRRSREATVVWALVTIAAVGLAVGRIAGVFWAIWAWRYFAPIVAPLLLLGALACARSKLVGVVALIVCVAFLANPSSFAPGHKSNLREVAAELAPRLHPGDLVVVGQPDQAPLAWYYLPAGLRFATTSGGLDDPRSMNWIDAQRRLQDADPAATLNPLVASLRPGQQLLYVRPLTEGAKYWSDPWSMLVRRRSAQWGQILAGDVAAGRLRPVAVAPSDYQSACCVADSAVLYQKA